MMDKTMTKKKTYFYNALQLITSLFQINIKDI